MNSNRSQYSWCWCWQCWRCFTYWSPSCNGQEPSHPFVSPRGWNCTSRPNTWNQHIFDNCFHQNHRNNSLSRWSNFSGHSRWSLVLGSWVWREQFCHLQSVSKRSKAHFSRSVSSTSHSLMLRYLNTAGKKLSISLRNISTDIFLYLDIGSGFCTKNTL